MAPAPRDFIVGWQIEPDMVVEAPTFEIPDTGTVEYTYYIVPETFTEDRWIKMSELRPSNREVTHHLLAYVRPPGLIYPFVVPVGEYFVLGDNLDIAKDSRTWGCVPTADILGKAYEWRDDDLLAELKAESEEGFAGRPAL